MGIWEEEGVRSSDMPHLQLDYNLGLAISTRAFAISTRLFAISVQAFAQATRGT
jgi:hypothetical protein